MRTGLTGAGIIRPQKIGVFSDVHGNLPALRETLFFLIYAQEVDLLLCCGDTVGYGCFPNECYQALQANKVNAVTGNHEKYIKLAWTLDPEGSGIDPFENPKKYPRISEIERVSLWTSQRLTVENRSFLYGLPDFISFPDLGLSICHSLQHNYVENPATAAALLDLYQTRIVFIGHTHQPAYWFFEEGNLMPTPVTGSQRIYMEEKNRYIINVGSVGQPRDDNTDACCVVFEPPDILSYHRIPYDVSEMTDAMGELAFPGRFRGRLYLGW